MELFFEVSVEGCGFSWGGVCGQVDLVPRDREGLEKAARERFVDRFLCLMHVKPC